jgi:hypothetical protein
VVAPGRSGGRRRDEFLRLFLLFRNLGQISVGRYLDLAKTVEAEGKAEGSARSESDRGSETSELCEKRCLPGMTAVLLAAPDRVPEDWAQGVADLLAMPPHADWPEAAWKTLQNDALAFLRERAAQAYALGWKALDLFGVHATASRARLDGMGLVPLLNGRPITAMSENSAAITAASGGVQTYRRRSIWLKERCLVWEPRPCEAVPLGNVRLAP